MFLGILGFKPGAAGLEVSMLPLCHAAPPKKCKLLALFNFSRQCTLSVFHSCCESSKFWDFAKKLVQIFRGPKNNIFMPLFKLLLHWGPSGPSIFKPSKLPKMVSEINDHFGSSRRSHWILPKELPTFWIQYYLLRHLSRRPILHCKPNQKGLGDGFR